MNYHPNNKNSDFKCNLFREKNLHEGATIALNEIFIPPVAKSYIAYVHINLISSYQVGESCASVLRCIRINTSAKHQHIEFFKPIFFKLKCNNFSEIHLSIRDAKGDLIPFVDESPTIAVLQIK